MPTKLLVALACAALVGRSDGRADDTATLLAGDPLVLSHPEINKSVGNPVHCLQFVRGGRSLATGAASGVLVWDVETGELRETLEVDDRGVESLAVDSGGSLLVAGGATGVVKVWNARTLEPIREWGPTAGAVRGLALSKDGRLLATTSPNHRAAVDESAAEAPHAVVLWDPASGERLRTIPHPAPEFGSTVLAFTPDGRRLVTAQDRTFRVIAVDSGEIEKVVERPELPRTLGHLAVRGDGRQLATGTFEPRVRLWDLTDWKPVREWNAHDREPPPRSGVTAIAYSSDGRYVVSGGMDATVCVWDAATGRRLLELDASGEASKRWTTGVALSPDGRFLAAAHFNGTATIWPLRTSPAPASE